MRALVLAVRWAGPASVLLTAALFDAVGAAVMMLVCLGLTVTWRARLPAPLELATGLVLLLAAWSSVFLLYERLAFWDLVVHFAATAVLAELAFRALERWGRLAAPGAVTHVLVATALGTALAVLWEYAEFVGNAAVDPRVQVGYRDTMGDLAAGTAGAVAAGIVGAWARHRGDGPGRRPAGGPGAADGP
ncbi:hypothetical protein MRU69_08430 [Kocuria flava]|uniref:hypothetical protein n=1 Tax=Kocuria flava TaxID=446860 RepID=UPI001FF5D552|nr:hypothetical protein [Kocuria flava]MCJ8504893.1 hypothetical protein [Kocuria flava]